MNKNAEINYGKIIIYIFCIGMVVLVGILMFDSIKSHIETRECEKAYNGCELLKCKAEAEYIPELITNRLLEYQSCLLEKQREE